MDTSAIIAIAGLFLTNLSIILAAWIKVKTDITSINVQLRGMEMRIADIEQDHSSETEKIHDKMDKFVDMNNVQHETISVKIDGLKEGLNNFKLDVIKQLK